MRSTKLLRHSLSELVDSFRTLPIELILRKCTRTEVDSSRCQRGTYSFKYIRRLAIPQERRRSNLFTFLSLQIETIIIGIEL